MATAPVIKFPETRLEPGIYLRLPEKEYHTDSAVGSSDIRTMRKGAHKYWHHSWMNPKRAPFDEKTTPSKIMGKAIHKELLEGREALAEMFVRRPADPAGASPSDKAAVTKKLNGQLKDHQFLLKADEYDFVLECGDLIKAHPDLGTVLDGGLREVSVIFDYPVEDFIDETTGETDGFTVRCKCRFDLLKPRGIGDLKSIANEMDLLLATACRRAITAYRYPLQAEHYLEGRRRLPELVKAGKIFGFPEKSALSTKQYLEAIADEKRFAFQYIFVPKDGDPDAESWTLSPGNDLLSNEREVIDATLRNYKKFLQTYGTEQRWPLIKSVSELTLSELPNWYGVE